MFRSSRWKSEKARVKAVFRLQFRATQVPQLKAKTLSISVVPEDIGKPTVRLEKAPIVDGACYWENPVYETVKLMKETKTGTFSEKCYHFIVSAGSLKTGILGQVSIDFADYAEAMKPSTISLPLVHCSNGGLGTILHVTIQPMRDSVDQRDTGAANASARKSLDRSWAKNLKNEDGIRNNNISFVQVEDRENPLSHQNSETDWSLGSGSDESMAESPKNPDEVSPEPVPLEASGRSTGTVERKILELERQAEISELELQSLRKQIVKETKKGEELSRQIITLKEEKEALETECKCLKSSKSYDDDDEDEGTSKLEEIKWDLDREKGLNKNLRLRLQKTEDSNSELVLRVRDLDKILKKKNGEIADRDKEVKEVDMLKKEVEELYAEIEVLNKEMKHLTTDYEILKQDNCNLTLKLEQIEMDKMNMKSECSEYLATIEEFQDQMEILEKQTEKQQLELQKSSRTITELENEVKRLEEEQEKQAQDYETDLEGLTLVKTEQEQRATQAEEALRKMRMNNAIEIERVHEEFRRVSLEMSSKFGENEKLASEAVAEANDLRLQKKVLEEMLHRAKEEIQLATEIYEMRLEEAAEQKKLKLKEIVEALQSEIDKANCDYKQLKGSFLELEIEKEKWRKEFLQLEELQRKENKIFAEESARAEKMEPKARAMEENGRGTVPNQSSDGYHLPRLLSEIEILKETNKRMERELKEMEERYSEISLKFAEVEGERQQLVMAVRNLKNTKKS